MTTQPHQLIIIGSGPAGLTAGIYAARAHLTPLILEGKNPGGQLMGTTYIENWPGNQRILGPELMMNMRKQAEQLGCTFLPEEALALDASKRPFTLTTNKNKTLHAQALIIATGASYKKLGIPGEQDYWGKGVTTCAVCDGAFYPDKEVMIVGGGDTAMEDASFMTKFTDKITVVHILDKFTASAAMQERVLNNPKIKIVYNSTLETIRGDGTHVTGATIINQKTGQKQDVSTNAIFIAIGLKPNTQPFQGQLAMNEYGYLDVHEHTKTSVPGIFVAGDVADYHYRQAVTSAGSGCMAALDAERYLSALKD
jgi:thioredoxin reductase (NADPH)